MNLSLAVRERESGETQSYLFSISLNPDQNGDYIGRLLNPENLEIFEKKEKYFDTLCAIVGDYIKENIGELINLHEIQADEQTKNLLKLIRYLNYPNQETK